MLWVLCDQSAEKNMNGKSISWTFWLDQAHALHTLIFLFVIYGVIVLSRCQIFAFHPNFIFDSKRNACLSIVLNESLYLHIWRCILTDLNGSS